MLPEFSLGHVLASLYIPACHSFWIILKFFDDISNNFDTIGDHEPFPTAAVWQGVYTHILGGSV